MPDTPPPPMPVVSVVMTSYADPILRLKRAIDSVLQQSFQDLELLVAFEPGDPNADLVLQAYDDPRLMVLKNPERKGMAASFNHCLDHARGRYIARMDSDDRALPGRLEIQLAFMDRRSDVDIVGGGTIIIDENGRRIAERILPAEHQQISRAFAFYCAISHPTVMWDTNKVGQIRYNPDFAVEDVEMWFRQLSLGRRFANIPEFLIEYKQTNDWKRPFARLARQCAGTLALLAAGGTVSRAACRVVGFFRHGDPARSNDQGPDAPQPLLRLYPRHTAERSGVTAK